MSFDNVCKILAEKYPLDFANWLLPETVEKIKVLKTELSIEPIRADSVILLQTKNRILHLEFQTRTKSETPIPLRMLDYFVRLVRQYNLPVTQVVIFLQETSNEIAFTEAYIDEMTNHRYRVIRMWEQDSDFFLHKPQLPPTSAIDSVTNVAFENWFEYPVRAQPHHTDYAGIVWHGTYLTWMEEARVECLRSIGIEFADLVALGCDLPVVELSIRYHQSVKLGMPVLVRTRMAEVTGVRMNWDYTLVSPDGQDLYITALVTLVALDREKGKIMRQLPPAFQDALAKISGSRKIR